MTINCRGNLIDLSTPKVMGILNITPDSFYDGGNYHNETAILNHTKQMLDDGATFIDVGAYSSKPNVAFVSKEEELKRMMPVIDLLTRNFPEAIISIDTFRSEVARPCVEAGAAMINDISGGLLDDCMLETVAQLKVPYIMMHLRGTPQTMQQHTQYDNLTKDILFYFSERIATARQMGLIDLILDPGFGFAKTREQNFELLQQLEYFGNLELPVLVGISRKSMIYKTLNITSQEALNGTTVLNTMALQKGASILRVHDVKQAMECIKLVETLKKAHNI